MSRNTIKLRNLLCNVQPMNLYKDARIYGTQAQITATLWEPLNEG